MEIYFKKQLSVAACIYIGQMLTGFSLGWTAPMIPKLQDPDETPLPDVITDEQATWVGSIIYVGSITGPYISGFLSNSRGRKPCLFLGAAVFFLAQVVLALAKSLPSIFIGRILNGVGAGILFVIHLVYIGEIASTNIRGMLLTATGISGTFGTLIVYSIGPFVPYSVTNYVGLAISLIYIVGIFFIPETPVFHVMIGKENEAKETLLSLGRADDIETVLKMKSDMETSMMKEWTEVFTITCNRKALFITLTLSILQQFSGIVVVLFFATSIFELAGSTVEPNIATIIIGVTQITASGITPFVVERSGRKSLLLFSTAFCCFSLALLGTYFYLDNINHSSVTKMQWLPLVTLIIFFLSYDLGFGIIPGTFIGEMFRTNVRSSGSTVTITVSWIFGFGVTTASGYMLSALGGYVTFWIYSCACAVAFIFTVVFVPETKGKSLMEIQEMLSKN